MHDDRQSYLGHFEMCTQWSCSLLMTAGRKSCPSTAPALVWSHCTCGGNTVVYIHCILAQRIRCTHRSTSNKARLGEEQSHSPTHPHPETHAHAHKGTPQHKMWSKTENNCGIHTRSVSAYLLVKKKMRGWASPHPQVLHDLSPRNLLLLSE